MNCQQTQANFDARLDHRLDAARRAEWEAHLNACPDCAAAWRAYQGAWNALGRHVAPEPSAGFVDRTLRRLELPQADPAPTWLSPLWRWVLGSALLAALTAGGWWSWHIHNERKTEAQIEIYVMAHQDRLEDFDVVAALHLLNEDNP